MIKTVYRVDTAHSLSSFPVPTAATVCCRCWRTLSRACRETRLALFIHPCAKPAEYRCRKQTQRRRCRKSSGRASGGENFLLNDSCVRMLSSALKSGKTVMADCFVWKEGTKHDGRNWKVLTDALVVEQCGFRFWFRVWVRLSSNTIPVFLGMSLDVFAGAWQCF